MVSDESGEKCSARTYMYLQLTYLIDDVRCVQLSAAVLLLVMK